MNLWVLDYRMKGIYEMKKGAFTLAEVLLTLAIIGVVAAMTVPSLMTSTEDKKLGAAAKKAYNTLQNAVTLKQAQTDLNPGDLAGVGAANLFDFLCGGANDNVRVLKTTEEILDSGLVQTPDGIVMWSSATSCGSGEADDTDPTNGCVVAVDVNGAEGPHFSGVTGGTTAAGAEIKALNNHTPAVAPSASSARTNRDLVFFYVNGMNVTPVDTDHFTMRYIRGKK